MARQFKPLPTNIQLGNTLARRVFELRELRNMTVKDLSDASRFGIKRIEELEQGMETWLSSTDRQVLARSLGVDPERFLEVEKRPVQSEQEDMAVQRGIILSQLANNIMNRQRDLNCPDCGGTLQCSIQEGIGLEGQLVRMPKASCLKCPFILR